MLGSSWSKFTMAGVMALTLAACETNQISHVKQPDGTIAIVDSKPEYTSGEATKISRAEGREMASICAAHSSNASKVQEALQARGWQKRKGLFGETLSFKVPGALWGDRISMNLKETCEFSSPNSWAQYAFQGAEARLLELGFKPVDSRHLAKGNVKVELSGSVRSGGSTGTTSNVKILRK